MTSLPATGAALEATCADRLIDSYVALGGALNRSRWAPSVHGTQPWRWCLDSSGAELWADRGRQLANEDPTGRDLVVSCGAALFLFRVALTAKGLRPRVAVHPEAGDDDLLARVSLDGFGTGSLDATTAAALDRVAVVGDATRQGSAAVRRGSMSGALEAAGELEGATVVRVGTAEDEAMMIGATGNTSADWLRSGQALGRIWLEAARGGVAIRPFAFPVGVAAAQPGSYAPHVAVRIVRVRSAVPAMRPIEQIVGFPL